MKHIKLFEEFVTDVLGEALDLSNAKKYTSIKRNPSIEKRLDDIFTKLAKLPNAKESKRRDRVYIPLKDSTQESSIENEIENSLGNTGYSLKNYQKGIATDKYGRDIKLGRVLTKLKKHDLLNKFNTDKSREGSTIASSYLAFSKHPYDIAGSSTDRGWTSCMNVYTGSNKKYIQHDIQEGTLVCYLVASNDLNINKPIARILIKPYINSKNMKDVLYVPENVYGTAPPQFKSQVSSIIDSVQGTKVGTFKLHGQLYCDYKREITRLKKEIQDILDGKKEASTKSLVEEILNSLGIKNYIIKDDLSVDVNGDVNISSKNLKQIPVQFGNVTGSFLCDGNSLTSLEGTPQSVGGHFECNNNSLTSLEHAPQSVGDSFYCTNNRLTSLKGAPQSVGGGFYCYDNSLASLKGAPQSVGGTFNCAKNSLTSLKGAPQSVGDGFYCANNRLTSLEGAPQSVGDGFYCSSNKLKSLEGAPQSVGGNFVGDRNLLTSLEGAPRSVGGYFACSYNSLTSLEGAPQSVGGGFYCQNSSLKSLEGAPQSVGGGFYCNSNSLTSLKGAPQSVGGDFDCRRNAIKFSKDDVRAVSSVKGNIWT